MKKTLLSLAVALSLGATAYGQTTPWWTARTIGPAAVPANYVIEKIHAVDANTVWVLTREDGVATVRNYARTTNGGTSWTGGAINIPASLRVANISAIDGTTAWLAAFAENAGAKPQQGIYKTTDGGVTWTRQASAAFSSSGSFPNAVYFWDANNGVCFGDAAGGQTAGQRLEIYTTTNGGTTWTVNNSAPQIQNALEYGNAGSYFVLGNTIWHGGVSDDGDTNPGGGIGARLYRSTDRGLTWSSFPTDLADAVSYIAFTDQTRGVLASGFDVTTTTNGGQTNQLVAYSGNFRPLGLDAVPGSPNWYVSVGQSVSPATSINDYGSSYSTDGGNTWTDMDTGKFQFEVDMLSNTVGFSGGYTGPSTGTSTNGMWTLARILPNRNAKLLKGVLTVAPNPSNDGIFTLGINAPSSKTRLVTVTDALGRVVYTTTLNATSVGQNVPLDLSKHKAGLYTLRLETEQGTAVEKLVIQ
ncbi:T9SS type A sorting domain-containing protein [Hymenobacter gummosus]|uniref:T9SS type A sorting domain-containing protein n=1 Tax=Hymenobacter gummosus TaxID=1776032 RepID=A0A431U7U0_9BACT|nr:T9SS type A sorting domain-containing protein [Hymenobacter gummosus]RTQ52327.1 T9SS type A sorting domain-containing protein [Hymenobacter gummosus]